VIGEAMVAFVLSDAFLEKFGGDAMAHIRRAHEQFAQEVKRAT
jgi:chorismate synthase